MPYCGGGKIPIRGLRLEILLRIWCTLVARKGKRADRSAGLVGVPEARLQSFISTPLVAAHSLSPSPPLLALPPSLHTAPCPPSSPRPTMPLASTPSALLRPMLSPSQILVIQVCAPSRPASSRVPCLPLISPLRCPYGYVLYGFSCVDFVGFSLSGFRHGCDGARSLLPVSERSSHSRLPF